MGKKKIKIQEKQPVDHFNKIIQDIITANKQIIITLIQKVLRQKQI